MSDIDSDDENEIINEKMDNINELGVLPNRRDGFPNFANVSGLDIKNTNNNRTMLNNTMNMHNKIAKNLAEDDFQEELDENNDAEPEELAARNDDDMNKSLDDIWAMQIYGKRDPNEKIIPFESKKAKFFERLLHPMQYGSLRGSIFGLSSMCLEASSMILAKNCGLFGMVNYLIAIVLGGLLAYWCLVMMIKAGKNIKEKNYSRVVKTILGKKVGVYMDVNIALYLFGVLISFMVINYQVIGSIVLDIGHMMGNFEQYDEFSKFHEGYWREQHYIKYPVMFGVTGLVFPLCLLKDISKMRIPSLLGVMALIYSIIVIIIESFFYLIKENLPQEDKEMNWYNIGPAFSWKKGLPIFGGISTVFYLYSCHAGAFPVYKALRNNTTRRIKKVFRRSIMLDVSLYFTVAMASFFTCPFEDPTELILYRKNLDSFNPDYFILIAKFGIFFNLFFSTPANYAGLRLSLFELIWGNTNITTTKNLVVTAVILSVVTLIGALYDKILAYIELLGGFCSTVYCILIPGLIYAKNDNIKKTKFKKYLIICTVYALLIFGYASGIFTILFEFLS